TDTVDPTITGTLTVNVQGAPFLLVIAPQVVTAGVPFQVSVTAKDASNGTITAFASTVYFGGTDPNAFMPTSFQLNQGTAPFSAVLRGGGQRTIGASAFDPVNAGPSGIGGNSGIITVMPAPVTHFSMFSQGTVTIGTPLNVTVTARDDFDNPNASYSGTVRL